MTILASFIQHSLGSLSYSTQKKKEIEEIQIGKKVKLSLFADDMMLYIGNPKDASIKWLEFISRFSIAAGYKINKQNFFAFLYANSKRSEREIKETISFITTSKRTTTTTKCQGINLAKQARDLYSENCKKLKKEIKDDTNKWKILIYCILGLEESILISSICLYHL